MRLTVIGPARRRVGDPVVDRRGAGRRHPAAGGGRGTRGCPPAPRIGDAITPRRPSPSGRRVRRPAPGPRDERPDRGRRRARSRPCPTSNWGLTSATIGRRRRGRSVDAIGAEDQGERDERDVDDGEVDRLAAASPASASRAFVRSRRRRGDRRGADRRAGRAPRRPRRHAPRPRWSRTSVKPPVEAPTSRQTSPAGSIPNASSAAASLWPPRLTYGSGSATSIATSAVDEIAGLPIEPGPSPSPDPDLARRGSAPAPGRVSAQAALDEELVEPDGRTIGSRRSSPAYRGIAAFTRTYPGVNSCRLWAYRRR